MALQERLESMCEKVPGAQVAMVMNLDGLVVVKHVASQQGLDDEILVVEISAAVRQAMQAVTSVEGGALSEFAIHFEKGALVGRYLKDDHFVTMLLSPSALLGQCRHELRCQRLPLIQDLF